MQPDAQAAPRPDSTLPTNAAGASPPPDRSVFIPALLVALALVVWLAFQAVQLVIERQQLAVAHASLGDQEQTATALRASLDAVATATAQLAADGNANARAIVEELRKRGVTINPADAPKPQ